MRTQQNRRRQIAQTGFCSILLGFCGAAMVHAQVPPSPSVFQEPSRNRPVPLPPQGRNRPAPLSSPNWNRPAPLLQPGGQNVPLPPNPRLSSAPPGVFIDSPRDYNVRDYSWLYIASQQPREIKQQDLVTILVKEVSEVTLNSTFNRQRRATLLAQLKEFIRIGKNGNLDNASSNEPTIDASLNGRINSLGNAIDAEQVVYKIAATVVEVLPNGNLVLEAQKQIQTSKEYWTYTLTGIIRSQDINRDNTALSENIANLQIKKVQSGKVYDSTKIPWGTRLYDLFFPF